MHDPSGDSLHMPRSFLQHTPFTDYFFPRLILLLVNGVLSLITAALVIQRNKKYPALIFLQGGLLFGWILVQAVLLRTFHFLQITYGALGLLLLFSGIALHAQLHPFKRKIISVN